MNRDRCDCWDTRHYPASNMHHKGYPRIGDDKAMHVALELDGRPRPLAPGNHCLHSCNNPACVNPNHLRWGTAADNQADRIRDNPESWPRGSANGFAKLTEDDVCVIRELAAQGIGQRRIAAMFGVTKCPIQRIIKGEGWKHVHCPGPL